MKKYNYISEIDEFLIKLEKEFSQKSVSRIAEEKKYRQIFALRDQKNKVK
jgi:hypothetical protein